MKIYIDNNFLCHLDNDGTRRSFDVPYFDGKCRTFIEGCCFIPAGESWTDGYGKTFYGEIIIPIKLPIILEKVQQQYEINEINYLADLGELIEDLYNADLEVIG